MRDPETAKIRYTPVIGFDDVEILRRFTDAALEALEVYGANITGPPQ